MRLRPTLLLLALAACRDQPSPPRVTLTVAAAASLHEVVTELDSLYRAEHPDVAVRATFGASGALRQQIEHGAPIDVFISASERHIDELGRAGLADVRSRRAFAGNELVLIVPQSVPTAVRGFGDLASPRVRRVALGAPESVPAGEYAEQALRSLGLAAAVAPKAVYAQNVRQVLAYVERGEVDAGLVYRTDALASDRVRVAASAPPGSHARIVYPLVLVTHGAHPDDARAYAAFLLGPRGRQVLARHGFRVP
ncbi:MAG TPA: molybdate ABC transporter substrate-binding protein [Longimicrobiaceae bacterium]|nr:molybdate ABC transporter substrate-binding protein [Longimicrobiaceae bacterium]